MCLGYLGYVGPCGLLGHVHTAEIHRIGPSRCLCCVLWRLLPSCFLLQTHTREVALLLAILALLARCWAVSLPNITVGVPSMARLTTKPAFTLIFSHPANLTTGQPSTQNFCRLFAYLPGFNKNY